MLALLLLLALPDTTLAERAVGHWATSDSVAYVIRDEQMALAGPGETPELASLGRILELTDSTATFVELVWNPGIGTFGSAQRLGVSLDGDSLRTEDGLAARLVVSGDRLVLESSQVGAPPSVYHRAPPAIPDSLLGSWGGLALDGVGGGVDVYLTFRADGTVHAQVGFTDEVRRFWILDSRLLLAESPLTDDPMPVSVSVGTFSVDGDRLTLGLGEERPLRLGRMPSP